MMGEYEDDGWVVRMMGELCEYEDGGWVMKNGW
jgi:hypothetical protein